MTQWTELIESAANEAQVVQITRDFVALWLPYELRRLPEECRPGRIIDGNDVVWLAFAMSRALAEGTSFENVRLLERLGCFFRDAAERITELRAWDSSHEAALGHGATLH